MMWIFWCRFKNNFKLLEYLEGGTIIRNSLFYKFVLRASS